MFVWRSRGFRIQYVLDLTEVNLLFLCMFDCLSRPTLNLLFKFKMADFKSIFVFFFLIGITCTEERVKEKVFALISSMAGMVTSYEISRRVRNRPV